MVPRRKAGTASKKPVKNTTAAGRTYDGLMTCVEYCNVHGIVNNQPQISQRGSAGNRFESKTANAASAPVDSTFNSTNGASGTGAILSGTPTSSACSAPGISLLVHTTSGPKYGQCPVA